MIGYESYLSWNDGNNEIYSHEENFGNYKSWMCGYHCTSYSQNQPITVGILIDRRSDANSGFYEGINIGSTAMKIGDVAKGAPGTIGLNFGSWWSGGYGETCIKYGYAHRHHVYKNVARISAPSMRIANENGICVLGVGSRGNSPAGIQFFGGADYDNILEGDSGVQLYASIRAFTTIVFPRTRGWKPSHPFPKGLMSFTSLMKLLPCKQLTKIDANKSLLVKVTFESLGS